jgi:hypothetical protein
MSILDNVLDGKEFDIVHSGDEGAEGKVLHVSDFFQVGVDIGAYVECYYSFGGFSAHINGGWRGDGDIASVVRGSDGDLNGHGYFVSV